MNPGTVLIVNTILCVIGFLPASGVPIATVMDCAADSDSTLGTLIAAFGFVFPAMPVISIIGSWLAHWREAPGWAVGFVALPWVYLGLLAIAVFVYTRPH